MVNIALHMLGLGLAAVAMRPGTPAASLNDRMTYLASQPLGWTLAWSVWLCCMVTMVAFIALVVQRLGRDNILARLALIVVVLAGAFDCLGDSLYLAVLPQVAQWQPRDERAFLLVEKATQIVSLVVANTLYSVATLLLSLALRVFPGVRRGTVLVGCGVFVFGMLLSAAGFTGVAWHVEFSTGPTIGLYCVWVILVARSVAPARGTV